jgi:FMN phosphatase YigB (HAD superfamily)
MVDLGLNNLPYETFTLKHQPDKTDPKFFDVFFAHFGLDKDSVVYFEHTLEAVHAAQSLGMPAFHYDSEKKDLESLKKFLDSALII